MARKRAHEHADERWLLTYADMITLLMALFMVMFSIASVDEDKYNELTRSLKDAFSGQVLSGGAAFLEQGASPDQAAQPSVTPPIPAIRPPGERVSPSTSPASVRED